MSAENKAEQIKQLGKNIELNKEILNSLKEFFGTYLSDSLKTYRNANEERDEELKEILTPKTKFFQSFMS